jgi:hypothetical protein
MDWFRYARSTLMIRWPLRKRVADPRVPAGQLAFFAPQVPVVEFPTYEPEVPAPRP